MGEAGPTTWNLNAFAVGEQLLLAYDARLGNRANELQLVALTGSVAQQLQLTPDDASASVYPDISASAVGQAASTWFDSRNGNEEVYLAVAPLGDLLVSAPLRGRLLTHSPGTSVGAYLAWNRDWLAVAWCDEVEGQDDLYVQMFDAQGRSLIDACRLTPERAGSLIPSISATGDGFLVGWNEFGPGHGLGHAEDPPSVAMTFRLSTPKR